MQSSYISLSASRRKTAAVFTPTLAQSCQSKRFRLFYHFTDGTTTECFSHGLYDFHETLALLLF